MFWRAMKVYIGIQHICASLLLCCVSDSIQQFLMTNSMWDAVGAIDRMASLDMGLRESGCSHLQDFLRDTLRFWHKILKDKLARY